MARPADHSPPTRELNAAEAQDLAETMKGLASPARLSILLALLDREQSVEQLSDAVGLGQSAVSHHLKLLRDLHLVRVRRDGRHGYYSLHDHHVPDLLAAIRHHREHVEP